MNIVLNLIWFVFGGFLIALEYLFFSLLLMITIVGIPFGVQTLKLAVVAAFPFGVEVVPNSSSGGCLSVLMNIIWILFGGIEIALSHLGLGIVFCITIIGKHVDLRDKIEGNWFYECLCFKFFTLNFF